MAFGSSYGPPRSVPVIAVVGPSGSGKTTLVVELIRRLCAAGVRVGSIKRSSCEIEPDRPGKDSHRHRKAGAVRTVLEAVGARALFEDTQERSGALALARRFLSDLDLVLAEGFHDEPLPRIEVGPPDPRRPQAPSPRRWRVNPTESGLPPEDVLCALTAELLALAAGEAMPTEPRATR